jgi:hypothetical protein
MNNTNDTNIGNSTYNFNFSLVKYNKTDNLPVYIPIGKSSITYLEINDNLANFGYKGTVIFANYNGILDDLGLGGGLNDGPTLFDINITNSDLASVKNSITDISIQTLVQLQQNTDTNINPIERNSNYTFEEYQVCLLRQKGLVRGASFGSSPSTNIKTAIINGINKDTISPNIGDFYVDDDIAIDSNGLTTNNITYYDYIIKNYNMLWYKDKGPGLLQLSNCTDVSNTNTILRKFTLRPLNSIPSQLFLKINQSQKEIDLKEYVTETFTIGNEDSAKSYRENAIEQFQLIRPNFETLLHEKWIDYTSTEASRPGDTRIDSIKYNDVKTEFEKIFLNNQPANLPTRQDVEYGGGFIPLFNMSYNMNINANKESPSAYTIKAMLMRSFIFDNTALVFRLPGNVYRKPGYFILVNSDTASDKINSVVGYWYVIGVKHIFTNNIYTNEIVAVKMHIKGATNSSASRGVETVGGT